jgi:hypothetical protein
MPESNRDTAAEIHDLRRRVDALQSAILAAIRSAEANGMGEWPQFAKLRKALET